MHLAEAGSGPPVILLHGFPELWYSWRHQLGALATAGFHVVAPDQRGYGKTDAPSDIESYDILQLIGDLTGLLDQLHEERAVVVGHDWGAIVAWQMALLVPHRVTAVAGLSVPFTPRPPVPPTDLLRAMAGDRFFYILYFQQRGPADRELGADPRRSLRMIFSANSGERAGGGFRPVPAEGTGFLDTLQGHDRLPGWLTEEDLDVYASTFAERGFTGPLNWYRNFDRNWEITEHASGAHVTKPALFATGDRDPVRRFAPAEIMEGFVDDLRGSVVLEGCGHWIQQERPDDVSRMLLQFLSALHEEGRLAESAAD
jgi:pimeloyl-ACP methyl ester carboxylesterase